MAVCLYCPLLVQEGPGGGMAEHVRIVHPEAQIARSGRILRRDAGPAWVEQAKRDAHDALAPARRQRAAQRSRDRHNENPVDEASFPAKDTHHNDDH